MSAQAPGQGGGASRRSLLRAGLAGAAAALAVALGRRRRRDRDPDSTAGAARPDGRGGQRRRGRPRWIGHS